MEDGQMESSLAKQIAVAVAGATGRVGREVVRALSGREGSFRLVGALGLEKGQDLGRALGWEPLGVTITGRIEEILANRPDVLIDFTSPELGARHLLAAVEAGVHPVVGTTSLDPALLTQAQALAAEKRLGGAVVPNFSLGAALLSRFAREARRIYPACEIIELHHDTKLDQPSGTARRLAEELTALDPSRKAVPVHSVRLPGFVAHHEVLFGGHGETLTLRHDSLSRSSFVAGVLMAVEAAFLLDHLAVSMDEILSALCDRPL
jgi:4-hydroxy-tetrahydrodipicolinate reductase